MNATAVATAVTARANGYRNKYRRTKRSSGFTPKNEVSFVHSESSLSPKSPLEAAARNSTNNGGSPK